GEALSAHGALAREGAPGGAWGGGCRGVHARDDPDGGSHAHGHGHPPGRDGGGQRRDGRDDLRQYAADRDADGRAGTGQDGGFDEHLDEDVAAAGTQRLAHADLAGALGDGHEHDVHDDDAADDERDRDEARERDEQDAADPRPERERVFGRFDLEAVGL